MDPTKGYTRNGKPLQHFNGTNFYLKPSGYFKCSDSDSVLGDPKLQRLHRAVWIYHHGPIPPEYVVHHKDSDKANNTINNLELLPKKEHDAKPKYTALERACVVCCKKFYGNKFALYCTPTCSKAAARIRAGATTGKKHSGNIVKNFTCVECGAVGEYRTFTNIAPKLYCSTKCKVRAKNKRAVVRCVSE